jgi:hypothetical protein
MCVYLTRQFYCNSMAEPGNALRLFVTRPDVEADRARRGGWGRERFVCPSIYDGFGWTGRGWPGGGPGPWSVNTADEKTGSPRNMYRQIHSYIKGGREAFLIHPSVSSSIHGWHHTGKKTFAEINRNYCITAGN